MTDRQMVIANIKRLTRLRDEAAGNARRELQQELENVLRIAAINGDITLISWKQD